MSVVAINFILAEAEGRNSEGGLANHWWSIIAILVSPDSVEQLVVTDDGHDAKRLDSVISWVESGITRFSLVGIVAENDVRVDIRINVFNSDVVSLNLFNV